MLLQFCHTDSRRTWSQSDLILQYASIFADWELMAEVNNSVYGNPSSLTIHNEKNVKAGECTRCDISSLRKAPRVYLRNFANYRIDFAIPYFNDIVRPPAVARARANKCEE